MPADPRDYKLDLSSAPPATDEQPQLRTGRPFLSVHFACCGIYTRIYRDDAANAYTGRCPRCGVRVHFPVGPGGTSSRCFVVR